MSMVAYLAARAKEASSWAGAATLLLGAMHVSANPNMVSASLGIVAAIGGLVSILVPEGSGATPSA